MAVPPEYTNALNALKAFRAKILTDLVAGRVIAGLNAGHDSMGKFKDLIDELAVVPYMFGRVKEYALALRFKGMDVGEGSIRRITASYYGTLGLYPMELPYKVPQRLLPKVDTFTYTPVLTVDMAQLPVFANLKSALLMQAEKGLFRDTPDTSDDKYDYYMLSPTVKYRSPWNLDNLIGEYPSVNKINGEFVRCVRQLIDAESYTHYVYTVFIWFDATLEGDAGAIDTMAVAIVPNVGEGAPAQMFSIAGQRLATNALGLYGTIRYEPLARGFVLVAGEAIMQEPPTVVWTGTYNLTMKVNDPLMGTTDPAVGTYQYDAWADVDCLAIPNFGYKFVRWERDDVTCGEDDEYTVWMDKDHILKAIFERV